MNGFYAIIYYKTNVLTDELISVGIIASGGEGPFIYLSENRLKIIQKCIHPNTFLSLRRHLKALQNKVNQYREKSSGALLFDPVFSQQQLQSLADQTRNAVVYSSPTSINGWLNTTSFEEFVFLFFGEKMRKMKTPQSSFHLKWKAYYRSQLVDNWQKDCPLNTIDPSALITLKIDLFDKTTKRIAKGIDFDWSKTTLQRKLYEIKLIKNTLPKYNFLLVYPYPKKKTGKIALDKAKRENEGLTFMPLREFKKRV